MQATKVNICHTYWIAEKREINIWKLGQCQLSLTRRRSRP